MNEHEVTQDSSEENGGDLNGDREAVSATSPDSQNQEAQAGEDLAGGKLEKPSKADAYEVRISPEELPTLQWPDIDAELTAFELNQVDSEAENAPQLENVQDSSQSGPLEGLEDAMSWLEELAAGQGIPIEQMPTLISAPPEVEDASVASKAPDPSSAGAFTTLTHGLDSDPMAWLEQLAVDQSSPLEELPSVADRLLESDIASQDNIAPDSTINDPVDIGNALSYLEQLAADQGIDLSTVVVDPQQRKGSLDEAIAIVDSLVLAGLKIAVGSNKEAPRAIVENGVTPEKEVAGLSTRQELDLSEEMPDDPMQALAWLSQYGVASGGESIEVVLEADTIGGEAELDAASINNAGQDFDPETDVAVLEEMPDDPDEAVAWMKGLAARKSQSDMGDDDPPAKKPQDSPVDADEPLPVEGALADAREALNNGDADKAIALYQQILDDEAADFQVASEIEDLLESQGESPRLLRLLGDAYMQTGQVDKAVLTYRKGFDHL